MKSCGGRASVYKGDTTSLFMVIFVGVYVENEMGVGIFSKALGIKYPAFYTDTKGKTFTPLVL